MVIFEVSQFMNFFNMNRKMWVLSQASKLVPWLLGLHLCSQPRGLATTRGAALLCCGGIFDEAGDWHHCLRAKFEMKKGPVSIFYATSLRDSDDISCYVCNSGPDMPCILRRTTTWNSLPLPVCIYTIYIYTHIYTIFDTVCGGCWF